MKNLPENQSKQLPSIYEGLNVRIDENKKISLSESDDFEFLQFYMTSITKDRSEPLSKHSLRAYQQDGRCLLLFLEQQQLRLKDLGELDVKQYCHHIIETYAIRTAIRRIDFFRRLLQFGYQKKFFSADYSIDTIKPKAIKGHYSSKDVQSSYEEEGEILKPRQMSLDEANQVINSFTTIVKQSKHKGFYQTRNQVIGELLLTTGMRASEVLSLNFRSFKPNNEGKVSARIRGKGRKERTVPIHNKVLPALKVYKEFLINEGYVLNNEELQKMPLLFAPSQGIKGEEAKRMSYGNLYRIVKSAVDEAEQNPNISPHWFRHTFVSKLLEDDVPLTAVRDLVGHSNIAITDIYAHILREERRHEHIEEVDFGF